MLRRWCTEQGFANASDISHVLMDGGVLSVPFDRLNDFYRTYIQSIKCGEHVFVVEQKTELYKFFMDVDYVSDEPLTVDQIESLSRIICDKVGTFSDSSCIVSVSKPKRKNDFMKTGIHYNWSGLVVDQCDALKIRTHVIAVLTSVYSSIDWNKAVDQSVYGNPSTNSKGSGFRMLWSHKKGKHEHCGGKGCMVCDQTGKITETEYLPILAYSSSGFRPLAPDPDQHILVDTVIRTQDPKNSNIPTPKCQPVKTRKEGSFTPLQTRDEIDNSELNAHLETFIRTNLKGQSDTRIQKIYKFKNSRLVKTTSRFCENIDREHNSNHVWFLVAENGTLCQRCFCRCETLKDRRHGFCKDFSGRRHVLPSKIVNLMFANKKIDTIKKNVYSHLSNTYGGSSLLSNTGK